MSTQHSGHRLDRRLAEGSFDAAAAEAVGRGLARHFASAPGVGSDISSVTPVALARRVQQAVAELAEIAPAAGLGHNALDAIGRRQGELLRGALDPLLDRIERGRIRRVPGDLRCERVALDAEQGLELDDPSVAARDVAEALGRLCVDLTARHAGRRAEQLLAAFALAADDYDLYRVIDFYERHQACRLAALTAQERPDEPATTRRFGLAALASGGRVLLPPIVIATTGPVASGKSTIAHALALRVGAPRVVADAVRDALLDAPAGWSEREIHEALWQRAFAPGFEERVYRAVQQRARNVLASGRPVVIDACMPSRVRRREVAELASEHGVPFWFVECRPDPAVLRKRLAARDQRDGCDKPAWDAIARDLSDHWEAWADDEPGHYLRLDTGQPVDQCLETTRAAIPSWPDRFPD